MALPPVCTAASPHQPILALLPAMPVDQRQPPFLYHTTLPDLAAAVAVDSGAVAAAAAAVAAATLGESLPSASQASLYWRPRPGQSPPAAAADEKLSVVKAGGVHKPKASAQPAPSTSPTGGRGAASGSRRNASAAASDRGKSNRAGSTDSQAHDNGSDEGSDDDRANAGIGGGGVVEHQQRQRFLERNRIAASKCRQKKKKWVQELERRAEEVTMQNRSLHIAIAQLKDEVMSLKGQLLAHHNCGCTVIHQYLQAGRAASEIMPAGMPLPVPPQPQLMSPPPPRHHHPPLHGGPAAAAAAAAVAAVAAGGVAAATTRPPLILQAQPQTLSQTQAALVVQQQQQQQQRFNSPQVFPPYHQHMPPVGLPSIPPSSVMPVASGAFGRSPPPRP